ncbi:MAG: DUF835 domain-containing protein [Thermoplasmata archaeon]
MRKQSYAGGSPIIRYIAAGLALALSVVIIVAVMRQRTIKAFQKNTLIFSILLLVCAIISNIIISVSAGLITQESSIIYSKKIQAVFDIFFGLSIGAFVVAMAVPNIKTAKDIFRYMTDNFPSSYFFYCTVMLIGLVGVAITPVEIRYLEAGAYTFVFPTWFFFTMLIVSFAVLIYIPMKMRTYLKRTRPHKHIVHDAYLIILAFTGYTVGELIFEIILPSAGIDLRAAGFVIQISLMGLVAYAIRDKTFLQDLLIPVPEAYLKTEKTYDLPRGYSYLVEESAPNLSFEVFKDLVTHGNQGLCITRTMPEKVRSMYRLEKTPIIWLTRVAVNPETLRPYPVGKISETIQHFIRAGKNTVVLLDGVEYLITHNDFKSVLTSLQDLNEHIAQHDSILIMPVDAEAMEAKQFALLRRDLRMIEKQPRIRKVLELEEVTARPEKGETETFEMMGRRGKAKMSEGEGHKQFLLLLVSTALAFCVLSTSFPLLAEARVQQPQYHVGDSWTYSAEITEQESLELSGTVSMEIVRENTVVVGDSTYDVVENEISGGGTFTGTMMEMSAEGSWTLTGHEYWDVEGVERVSTFLTIEAEGRIDFNLYQLNFSMATTTRTEDDIISDTWHYPLEVGQTGSLRVNRYFNKSYRIEIEGMDPVLVYNESQEIHEVNYTCEGVMTITVEAGSFEVYLINKTGSTGSKELNYYLPEAAAGAKIEIYSASGERVAEYSLRSYSYDGPDGTVNTYLGLPVEFWVLIAIAVNTAAILSIAWFLLRRRRNM